MYTDMKVHGYGCRGCPGYPVKQARFHCAELIFLKVLPNIGLPLLGLNPDEETQHEEPFNLFKSDTEAPRGISSWKSWNWILNSPPFALTW